MLRRAFLTVLIGFAVSVLVRLPHLGRPLSAHHEYCTAVALIILHNWWVDGFATHHGAPVISFTTPADRYTPDLADGPGVHDGLQYYFSHPPLAYDLPYLVFVATGTPPDPLGLQVFNLLFHLVAAWCLLLALRAVLPEEPVLRAPLFAALLYLFMPAPLWFHGNAYMSDMFVQDLWLIHLAIALPVFAASAPPDMRRAALFFVTLGLTVYTSWPGVFAAVTASALAVWKWRKQRDPRWLWTFILCGLAVVLPLAFTVWRYTRSVDVGELIAYFSSRLAVRGSSDMTEGVLIHVGRLIVNYRMGYLPVLLLLVFLIARRWRKRTVTGVGAHQVGLFAALTGIPVLLDHAFLLQYADHDFAALKAGPLLCGVAAAGLGRMNVRWAWAALAVTCLAGVLYFYRVNPWPDGVRYQDERTMGLRIAEEARPDEAVFTLGFTPEPQVQWYAKRTLFRVDSLPQVAHYLERSQVAGAVVFEQRGDPLVASRPFR
jgi:hypothetical protein